MADEPETAPPNQSGNGGSALLLFGLIALFACIGGGIYVWSNLQKRGPAAPMTSASTSLSPTGSPRAAGQFAERLLGKWRLLDGAGCPIDVTMRDGQLIVATGGRVTVHHIEGDKPLETHTRVAGPDPQTDHAYVLKPEFFATSDVRSFNLVVEDKTAGTRETWAPCEQTP